jgi:hypothetical protein
MKILIHKIISSDRFILVTTAAIIVVAALMLITFISSNSTKSTNKKLKEQIAELQTLRAELLQVKDAVESKEKKIGLTKISSVVSALEQMLSNLGIKAKVIKPLEKKSIREFTEEGAELQIENIDLNRVVNLLYTIEHSPVPLKIKDTTIKKTFEKQDTFILELTASLISKPR